MPVDWTLLLKNPGDTVTTTDWDNLFEACRSVLGAAASGYGVQNADVPDGANIPNAALDKQLAYSPLVWDNEHDAITVGVTTDGVFPPTSTIALGDATYDSYRYYMKNDGASADLVFAVDGKVKVKLSLATNTYLSAATAMTSVSVTKGQIITICSYETGTGPAVNADVGDEVAQAALHIEFYPQLRMDA